MWDLIVLVPDHCLSFYFSIYRWTGPGSPVVECPLQGTVGHGFDPGRQHTKVVKMVLAARSSLCT